MLVKLTDQEYGWACHDKREYQALNSLVPYVRDRVIYVLQDMTGKGFQPYVMWGRRTLKQQLAMVAKGGGIRHSRHLVGKAADIVNWLDLKRGGSGWVSSPEFKLALARAAETHGLKSGIHWKRYGPFGDHAHVEYS